MDFPYEFKNVICPFCGHAVVAWLTDAENRLIVTCSDLDCGAFDSYEGVDAVLNSRWLIGTSTDNTGMEDHEPKIIWFQLRRYVLGLPVFPPLDHNPFNEAGEPG